MRRKVKDVEQQARRALGNESAYADARTKLALSQAARVEQFASAPSAS